MAFESHDQLGEQQFRHRVCDRIVLLALLLQLGDRLAHLRHAAAAQAPVGFASGIEKTGDMGRPVDVQFEPVRAVDHVLQHQIVNRGVGVFVFGANVKQIATRNAVGPVIEDV